MKMTRSWLIPTLVAVAAVAFAFGTLFAPAPTASAQAGASSTLPPIFQVGNTVTFGPQGPNLTVVQVYGDWIFAEQQILGGFTTSTDQDTNASNRFWVYVPRVQDSWRLVKEAT
jgi:hypothetical protein